MDEIKQCLSNLKAENKINIGAFDSQGCIMISMYDAIIQITQENPNADCAIDFCYDGMGETPELTLEYSQQLQKASEICTLLNALLKQKRWKETNKF